MGIRYYLYFFFFNDTATTEIYTLSLHDALPIFRVKTQGINETVLKELREKYGDGITFEVWNYFKSEAITREQLQPMLRSEEHTSELQSRQYLVCRLLLEKKKKIVITSYARSDTQ